MNRNDNKPNRDNDCAFLKSRAQVADHIFDALMERHSRDITSLRAEYDRKMSEDVEALLAGQPSTVNEERYALPKQKTYEAIGKLSRGFALSANDLSLFFSQGAYIGGDIKDVVENPESVPDEYPNSIGFTYLHFLNALTEHLPDDFLQSTPELTSLRMFVPSVAHFTYEQTTKNTTQLNFLIQTQDMVRILPDIIEGLESRGKVNLATIAKCFETKAQVMRDDIIARTESAIANDLDQTAPDNSTAPEIE